MLQIYYNGHTTTKFEVPNIVMNINGIYKVNIEQTVRKMGESDDATIQRLLGYAGLAPSDIPADPAKEAKIQKLIAEQRQDELATTMRLEIAPDRASIRSVDGDVDYTIKSRKVTGDRQISIVIEIPDGDEDMQWDITVIDDRILVFTGENEMSGFVLERL